MNYEIYVCRDKGLAQFIVAPNLENAQTMVDASTKLYLVGFLTAILSDRKGIELQGEMDAETFLSQFSETHPLNKIDEFFNLPAGTTKDVLIHHNTKSLTVLRNKLSEHGISVNDDTSVSKLDRKNWAKLGKRVGLPSEWWKEVDEPDDIIPTLSE